MYGAADILFSENYAEFVNPKLFVSFLVLSLLFLVLFVETAFKFSGSRKIRTFRQPEKEFIL